MKLKSVSAAMAFGALLNAAPTYAEGIEHVLLVSIDGLHALDVANYVQAHPTSALARLSQHGITYSNARTPANSDSFPGLVALTTGGSPISSGLFYDASYDRAYYGNGDSKCAGATRDANGNPINISGVPAGKGSSIAFDESIDLYVTDPVSGLPVSQNVIDPTALPFQKVDGKCLPVFPHNAIKTNTIFEVVKAHGGVTAWADKHPAYEWTQSPSGKGVDDLYTPEVTNQNGFDNTVSVVCTARNDHLKVDAVLNQIKGLSHDGKRFIGVPAVFGMNFQAVSVGQKLASDNVAKPLCPLDTGSLVGTPGGYLDGSGTPTAVLAAGLDATDASIEEMIDGLQRAGIYDSTLFIVTAKHGQSPINPVKVNKPGHFTDLVAAVVNPTSAELDAFNEIAAVANCSSGPCGFAQDDDVALLWLQHPVKAGEVAKLINDHAKELFVEEVLAGNEIKLKFNDPAHDHRTPDIIVQPQYGTVYTGSSKKNAEHGGFSFADTNVGLIVSNPNLHAQTIKTPVLSSQVAATILEVLGIDPQELKAVRVERTDSLPGLKIR